MQMLGIVWINYDILLFYQYIDDLIVVTTQNILNNIRMNVYVIIFPFFQGKIWLT